MQAKLLTLCMALCVVCLTATSQNVPDNVPTEGLVGWWPFNGGANDESEFSNNGVVNGATLTADRFGTINSAYLFDGLDDFIRSTSVISNIDTVSMSMWIQLNSNQGGSFIHIGHDSNYPECDGFGLGNGDGGSYYYAGLNLLTLSSCNGWINSTVDLTVSNWFHLVFVKENLSGSYYLDGDFLGSQNLIAINQPSDSVYFGNVADSGALSMHGKLDDVGIWNRALTDEEVLGLYNAELPVSGCTDSIACNFNEEANNEDGSCVYPLFGEDCETGAAACGEGTEWDVTVQACIVSDFCQEDLDGDGAIGVTDLMQLLSLFGTDCPIWMCGDPVNYDGYDYATVQIGEQCWFAENLRTEHYANGDAIPGELSDFEWSNADSTNLGAQAIHTSNPANLAYYGRLYNWYAVDDERGLCLAGWHVPTDSEFMTLEMELGMSESAANGVNSRGTDQGMQLKSSSDDFPSWNGTNTSGFSGLAGGVRYGDGSFYLLTSHVYFWSASPNGDQAWYRNLYTNDSEVSRNYFGHRGGFSVRCVRD